MGRDVLVMIRERVIPRATVTARECILQIDVERAWKEMQLEPGWDNEVTVHVYITL